ncbi:hypothetical protein ANN_18265 [Periplaneta americana]|uniref:Mos1 transposase HTH domain-containing protein n=1 Tax=Periplaneta americana TaxID=6978 RepID=A0ABQ8SP92_PERAM|nr:hypothetical protein ANN_18265 [Periplaneta americana]
MVDNDGSFRQLAVIKFLVKEEKSAAEIHLSLQRAYGDVCMGASSVRGWMKHFEDGNTSIQDESRSGRPRTAFTERNKERVDEFWDPFWLNFLNQTINAVHYSQRVLKLRRALREKRSGKKIILQHDYAWPHTDRVTVKKIRTFGWETLPHSPYSSDLAPSDYYLFGSVKEQLRGQRNETLENIRKAVRQCFREDETEFYCNSNLQNGGKNVCKEMETMLKSDRKALNVSEMYDLNVVKTLFIGVAMVVGSNNSSSSSSSNSSISSSNISSSSNSSISSSNISSSNISSSNTSISSSNSSNISSNNSSSSSSDSNSTSISGSSNSSSISSSNSNSSSSNSSSNSSNSSISNTNSSSSSNGSNNSTSNRSSSISSSNYSNRSNSSSISRPSSNRSSVTRRGVVV